MWNDLSLIGSNANLNEDGWCTDGKESWLLYWSIESIEVLKSKLTIF